MFLSLMNTHAKFDALPLFTVYRNKIVLKVL